MTILTYNGQNIEQRDIDGYLNATQMAAVENKLIADWLRSEDCKRYTAALSLSMGISIDRMVISKPGRPSRGGGTWIHPKLAIKLGRWISVDFELWCDEHIRTLISTGSTSIITDHRLDPDWQKERQDGKDVRRSLTDATKAWIERNCPDLKDWEKRMIYAEHSDALNVALFGRTAKELIEYFDCKKNKLRDQFTKQEINALRSLEWMAIRLVDIDNLHPVKAVHEAVKLCLAKGMFVDHHTEPLPPSEPKAKQKRVAKAKTPKSLPPVLSGQLNLFG